MKTSKLLMIVPGLVALQGCSAAPQDETPVAASELAITSCESNNGANPMMAALAVATARELKRFNPLVDFAKVARYGGGLMIGLSSAGTAQCNANGGCPNTIAILNMQDPRTNTYWDGTKNVIGINQNLFNASSFASMLCSLYDSQGSREQSIQANNPAEYNELAAGHKLASTSAFTPTPPLVCNTRFYFKATKLDGTLMAHPGYLADRLFFFGLNNGNQYLNFVYDTSTAKIGIDPDDTGNTTPTSTGACVIYPLDKAYDPNQTLKGTCCTTSSTNLRGTMQPLSYNPRIEFCKPN